MAQTCAWYRFCLAIAICQQRRYTRMSPEHGSRHCMQITIRADRDLRQSRQGTAGPEGYGVDIEIPSRSLRIGMYVSRLDRPWEDSPFLFQGFEITSRDEIEQ